MYSQTVFVPCKGWIPVPTFAGPKACSCHSCVIFVFPRPCNIHIPSVTRVHFFTFLCFQTLWAAGRRKSFSELKNKKTKNHVHLKWSLKKKTQNIWLLHILNPFKSHIRVWEQFTFIIAAKRKRFLFFFFFDQGCISYCPSVAVKKSLRVLCRNSNVGRSSGFCFQHIIMIS